MVLLDINEDRLKELCQTINEDSNVKHDAVSFSCDITNFEQMQKVCDAIRAQVGHPTILINNAGMQRTKN